MPHLIISVITVCRNAQATIEATILSVLNQRYSHVEYIIIDGQSTDGTLKIIEKYKDRIHKIVSEKDRGIYDAMNKGIHLSRGEIIYFLNADDRLFDEHVLNEVADQFNKSASIDILYGKAQFENVPPGLSAQIKNYAFEYKSRWQMLTRVHPQQCYFARRRIFTQVGLFNENYQICADYDWLLRCSRNSSEIRFWDRCFCYCNCQGASYTRRYEVIGEKILVVYKNSNLVEFIAYFFYAALRKIKDMLVEAALSLKSAK